jgi:hypothetical protein
MLHHVRWLRKAGSKQSSMSDVTQIFNQIESGEPRESGRRAASELDLGNNPAVLHSGLLGFSLNDTWGDIV